MKLHVENFGPFPNAAVTLGELNVSVGPQATSQSLFWQLLKLLLDAPTIRAELCRCSSGLAKDTRSLLSLYFGEGLEQLVQPEAVIKLNGRGQPLARLLERKKRVQGAQGERLFYIPAQRGLALCSGLASASLEPRAAGPFVARDFSEKLYQLLQPEAAKLGGLLPQANQLNGHLRKLLDDAFFQGFGLELSRYPSSQPQLVLRREQLQLPLTAWSAGQREFLPLLLGLSWLLPAGKAARRADLQWVVIEEPELGLHPKAIAAFMALVFELLRRGYRVCLSTHSPQVLDVVWGLQALKAHGGTDRDVLRLLNLPSTPALRAMAAAVLGKAISVLHFKPDVGPVAISSLDPGSADADVAGWGGLTELSATVGDVVAEVVARGNR
jgi:hypothetical protein